jgi:GT2 family glycosyltransferase
MSRDERPRSRPERGGPEPEAHAMTRIAVAISTRDRAPRLAALLDGLRAQTLADFEIAITDDGSTDATREVLAGATDLPLTVIRHAASQGPAAGRNAAWRATTAPLVAFIDDDCLPDPGWLAALLEACEAHPGAFVQGSVSPEPVPTSVFTRTLTVDRLGPWYQTANIAYPRELLEALGGFDEVHRIPGGEDTDLAWRALELGRTPAWAPDAQVVHAVHRLGPRRQLVMALAWSDVMQVFRRHPGVREHVYRRVFWKESHALLLLAATGLALAARWRVLGLLALPYARHVLRRSRAAGSPAALAAWLAVFDAVETFATVRGGLRHRTFVL